MATNGDVSLMETGAPFPVRRPRVNAEALSACRVDAQTAKRGSLVAPSRPMTKTEREPCGGVGPQVIEPGGLALPAIVLARPADEVERLLVELFVREHRDGFRHRRGRLGRFRCGSFGRDRSRRRRQLAAS